MLESLLTVALTAIISGIKKSKGAKQASDEFSVAVWKWIRPFFFKEDEILVKKVEEEPENPKNKILLEYNLEKIVKQNPQFLEELKKMFATREGKNIIRDLEGDKNEISQHTDKQNVSNEIERLKGNENKIIQGGKSKS